MNSLLRGDRKRVVAVYMVGGLTYSEVSALRILEAIYKVELVVCTTNIVSYKEVLECLIEESGPMD